MNKDKDRERIRERISIMLVRPPVEGRLLYCTVERNECLTEVEKIRSINDFSYYYSNSILLPDCLLLQYLFLVDVYM